MDVRFYGRLGERLGRQVKVELPDGGCSIEELRRLIAGRYPEAGKDILTPRIRACAGDSIVPEDHRVHSGETIEFFPPVSGG